MPDLTGNDTAREAAAAAARLRAWFESPSSADGLDFDDVRTVLGAYEYFLAERKSTCHLCGTPLGIVVCTDCTEMLADEGKRMAGLFGGAPQRFAQDKPMALRHSRLYRVTPDHLREVAKVYRDAEASRKPPAKAVEEAFSASYSTATRWIGQARKAGFLEPAPKNKEG